MMDSGDIQHRRGDFIGWFNNLIVNDKILLILNVAASIVENHRMVWTFGGKI